VNHEPTTETGQAGQTSPPPSPQNAIGWRRRLRAWYQASRPPFYIATASPLVLGLVLAAKATGDWYIGRFIMFNLGAFMVHLATNLADDLFDHLQGTDAGDSIGGSRVIQEGTISTTELVWALAILYLAALAVAYIMIQYTGQPGLWLLVAFAGMSSLFYVAPPIKYGYLGLGELVVFLNMGLVMVGGIYCVMTEQWRWDVLWYGLPIGLMVANILYYQSLPDMKTDARVGKRTLAVRLGKPKAALVFRLWWAATYLSLIGLWVAGLTSWLVWASLLTLPLFFKASRLIRTTEDWLDLDQHGHLVRKLYLANAVVLILSVVLWS